MVHILGIKHKAADAISRHPTGPPHPAALHIPDDIAIMTVQTNLNSSSDQPFHPFGHPLLAPIRTYPPALPLSLTLHNLEEASPIRSHSRDCVKDATASDPNMEQLRSIIEAGFPSFPTALPPELYEYYQLRTHLLTIDDVVLYKNRIVILPSLHRDVVHTLHSAHQDVTPMLSRAETIFWPGITSSIRLLRESCQHCTRMAPSQPNPPSSPLSTPTIRCKNS